LLGSGDEMGNKEGIWNRCLNIIASQINPQSFRAWFERTRQIPADDDSVLILADSQFVAEWLAKEYSELIKRTVETVTGEEPQIFVVFSRNGKYEYIPLLADERKSEDNEVESVFNPRYTFDQFVVGEFNRLAYTAAMAVAEAPGKTKYNPLYIYGGVGLGKTHLLQAIGHFVKKNHPEKVVRYVTSERFTDRFVNSLINKTTTQFKQYFRKADLLLVDDVQFFSGKEAIQNEFFHIFNALHQRGQQIVLTSDLPPSRINGLAERLRSRFEWGLLVDLQPPEFESRVAILRRKAEADGIEIPQEVLSYIAQVITTNIRDLEGALIRLLAYSSIQGKDITLEFAVDVLNNRAPMLTSGTKNITLQDILKAVCERLGVSEELVKSRKRTKRAATARQIAMYLARKLTNHSLSYIGSFFGGRDHATVVHACKKISTKGGEIARIVHQIQSRLTGGKLEEEHLYGG